MHTCEQYTSSSQVVRYSVPHQRQETVIMSTPPSLAGAYCGNIAVFVNKPGFITLVTEPFCKVVTTIRALGFSEGTLGDPQRMPPVFRAKLNGLFGLLDNVPAKASSSHGPAANSVAHKNLDEIANHEYYLLNPPQCSARSPATGLAPGFVRDQRTHQAG